MVKQWLAESWKQLLPRLSALTVNQEEEIARICLQEIESWRARPQMKKLSSLSTPMTDTRNAIKERLPITPENSWINPRTGAREHIALKYMNFSEEEWAALHAPSLEVLEQRMQQGQLIPDAEAVVAKGTELLKHERWEDIAVGLAVTTGRRLSEVLKTGFFLPKSRYTLVFDGQLKRRDSILDPFEIPTLCQSNFVLEGWQRLREFLDCTELEPRQISDKYSRFVSAAANHHFSELLPTRPGKDDLYTHLFRTVYSRITVLFYAPDWVIDIDYMSHIQGHYWVDAATGETKKNYLSTLHYYDYRVADGQGNIDGRQGIKLGEPGVKILDVFQRKEEDSSAGEKEEKTGGTLKIDKASKTGYSMYKPKQKTKIVLDQIGREERTRSQDETLSLLAEEHYLYKQMAEALKSLSGELEAKTPVETLAALVAAYRDGVIQERAVKQQVQERWHTSPEELDALIEEVSSEVSSEEGDQKQENQKSPIAYLIGLVEEQKQLQENLRMRHKGKDFTRLPLSKLKKIRAPEATTERFRRAVNTIMEHNRATTDPMYRWYINATTVHGVAGGRPATVADYLQTRKEEIDAHHQELKIESSFNRKPFTIGEKVQIPEEPPVTGEVSSEEAQRDDLVEEQEESGDDGSGDVERDA